METHNAQAVHGNNGDASKWIWSKELHVQCVPPNAGDTVFLCGGCDTDSDDSSDTDVDDSDDAKYATDAKTVRHAVPNGTSNAVTGGRQNSAGHGLRFDPSTASATVLHHDPDPAKVASPPIVLPELLRDVKPSTTTRPLFSAGASATNTLGSSRQSPPHEPDKKAGGNGNALKDLEVSLEQALRGPAQGPQVPDAANATSTWTVSSAVECMSRRVRDFKIGNDTNVADPTTTTSAATVITTKWIEDQLSTATVHAHDALLRVYAVTASVGDARLKKLMTTVATDEGVATAGTKDRILAASRNIYGIVLKYVTAYTWLHDGADADIQATKAVSATKLAELAREEEAMRVKDGLRLADLATVWHRAASNYADMLDAVRQLVGQLPTTDVGVQDATSVIDAVLGILRTCITDSLNVAGQANAGSAPTDPEAIFYAITTLRHVVQESVKQLERVVVADTATCTETDTLEVCQSRLEAADTALRKTRHERDEVLRKIAQATVEQQRVMKDGNAVMQDLMDAETSMAALLTVSTDAETAERQAARNVELQKAAVRAKAAQTVLARLKDFLEVQYRWKTACGVFLQKCDGLKTELRESYDGLYHRRQTLQLATDEHVRRIRESVDRRSTALTSTCISEVEHQMQACAALFTTSVHASVKRRRDTAAVLKTAAEFYSGMSGMEQAAGKEASTAGKDLGAFQAACTDMRDANALLLEAYMQMFYTVVCNMSLSAISSRFRTTQE